MRTATPKDQTTELFQKAVLEHSRRLLTVSRAIVGNRVSPEDIVQQALTNLYEHRARYDWNEPGPLLRRAVVNESLRALRHPAASCIAEDYVGTRDLPIHHLMDRETVQQVRSAIDQLPGHYRAALVLCEYENLAYTDIAETLNASIPQVKTWLHRARRQLARLLADCFDPSDLFRASSGETCLSARLR